MKAMSRLRWLLGYALAWVPVALVYSLALLLSDRVPGSQALVAGFSSTLPAALLGLGVVALAQRLAWSPAGAVRFLAVHGAAAIAYSVLWLGAIIAQMRPVAPSEAVDAFLRFGAPWQGVFGVLAYVVVAGITYARAALRRQQAQERAAERAETLRLKAELEALRARLEPHFLFNVLQTIGALITDQPSRAHEALELLASLLKRRLEAAREGDDASLADEMADVREYCALERLRLGARLTVVEALDAGTEDLLVPRFTLQPLVENAIRHGIASRLSPGRLRVAASRNGTSWTLTIEDDGAGADPAALENPSGVGLSVVRERLRLRFGARAAVVVGTSPGAGCHVTLTMPVDAEEPATTARAAP
jgi:hypothetical protein